MLDFVHREIEVECLPADIPDVDRRRRHRAEHRTTPSRARPRRRTPTWKPVTDADTMLVHVVAHARSSRKSRPPAEGAAAARRGAAAGAAEPEVIKKGKTDKEGEEAREEERRAMAQVAERPSRERHEADCRARESGPRISRDAAQRRLHGRSTSSRGDRWRRWRCSGARCSTRLHAKTFGDDQAVLLAKPLTFMNLSGDAVAGCRVLRDRTGRSADRRRRCGACRSAGCGRVAADRRAGTTA